MNNNNISKLAKYGLSGVCIALIVLMGWFLQRHFKYIENAIDIIKENSQTQQGVIDVVHKLEGTVDDLDEFLRYQNGRYQAAVGSTAPY